MCVCVCVLVALFCVCKYRILVLYALALEKIEYLMKGHSTADPKWKIKKESRDALREVREMKGSSWIKNLSVHNQQFLSPNSPSSRCFSMQRLQFYWLCVGGCILIEIETSLYFCFGVCTYFYPIWRSH